MAYSVAAIGFTAGLGLTIYGGQKYLKATLRPIDEVYQQKKIGLLLIIAGITSIAMSTGLIYSEIINSQMPKNPVVSFPTL